jgi:hypothetical protein
VDMICFSKGWEKVNTTSITHFTSLPTYSSVTEVVPNRKVTSILWLILFAPWQIKKRLTDVVLSLDFFFCETGSSDTEEASLVDLATYQSVYIITSSC